MKTRLRDLRWHEATGFAALLAMLVLLSPGVQVRAEERTRQPTAAGGGVARSALPLTSQSGLPFTSQGGLPFTSQSGLPQEDAGSCQIGDDRRELPGAGQVSEALRQLARTAPEDVVVFDGRGRNYRNGNDALAEIRRIREEIRREQAHATP